LISLFPVVDNNKCSGYIFTTGIPNCGNKANGMNDSISNIVHIDTKGNIIRKLDSPGSGVKMLTLLRVFAHPGNPDLFVLHSRSRLGGNTVNDFLEIRRISDFSLVSHQQTESLEECVLVPVKNSDRFYILGANLAKNPVFYNEKLEKYAELNLEEGFEFHSYAYQLRVDYPQKDKASTGAMEPLFVLYTDSGRMLVIDIDMNILSAEKLADNVVSPGKRNSLSAVDQIPRFHLRGRDYWSINSSSGVLTGYWTKRPKMLDRAISYGVMAIFCWLIYYALFISRRWRFYMRTVDSLYKSSPDAILILNSKFKVRTMNKRFEYLLKSRTAAINSTPASKKTQLRIPDKAFTAVLKDSPLSGLADAIIKNSIYVGKIEIIVNNQPLSLLYRFDRMSGRLGVYGYLLVVQDITRQLAENRRLIWKFMAQNTAHRLKSPLQRVSFQAESILHRLGTGRKLDTATLKSKAASILETSGEINAIVRDFLDISDRGVNLRPLNLRKFLKKNIQNYREKYHSEGIVISLDINEDLPEVMADDYHLLSMLINLLDNSLKAVDGSGRINVNARKNTIEDGRDTVRLIVSDDGIGIGNDILPRIFEHHESFFRDGHGIGLAVVHSVVNAHKGEISVESEIGVGTRFLVDLPVKA
jgi:signal transduction histidine kinase